LSNTKFGAQGCLELAKGISACDQHKLKHLDLSNNSIESKGFAKLLDALRESTQIGYLNVAENDMSLYQEHFESLTLFLKQNESL
jgi:Ran GTPase-activating protein (RanGAP) involved in mRNA processing and transport